MKGLKEVSGIMLPTLSLYLIPLLDPMKFIYTKAKGGIIVISLIVLFPKKKLLLQQKLVTDLLR